MTIQRRLAPIGGHFDPESLAGLPGIYISGDDYYSRFRLRVFFDL